MPASSKAQQRLMGLVKAVQAGDVPKSKVSKAVQKMADKMERVLAKIDLLSTPLPNQMDS